VKPSHVLRRVLLTTSLLLATTCAFAQGSGTQVFEPRVGQPGKDVVWVPTPQALVDKMLDMAQATPQDYVYDLGSGDGRTVITAAKRGIRAHGIEYNPDMVELSKRAAAEAGVTDKATFEKADLFQTDFSKATVITMFLLPSINMQLRPKILDLKPGTRVVANTFDMEDWQPDQEASITPCPNWCKALLWIVPAKVGGAWRTAQGELTLAQTFQMLTGTLGSSAIAEGRMRGDEISFRVGDARYTGRVNGNRIEGRATSGSSSSDFVATRAGG
jgi:SAM-dependent methyltransferase